MNAAAEDPVARNRRLHLPGRPSKLDADPELLAFVQDRIDCMTFAAFVAEAALHFPPVRRPSLSGLHRWWHRHHADFARHQPQDMSRSWTIPIITTPCQTK